MGALSNFPFAPALDPRTLPRTVKTEEHKVKTSGPVDLYLPSLRVQGSEYFFENDIFVPSWEKIIFKLINKVNMAFFIPQI